MTEEQLFFSIRMRIHHEGAHLSGAEDLVPLSELEGVLASFSNRILPLLALKRFPSAQQVINIDYVPNNAILRKSLLPVQTLNSNSTEETLNGLLNLIESLLPHRQAQKILDIFYHDLMNSPPRVGALLVTPSGKFPDIGQIGSIRTTHVGCTAHLRKTLDTFLKPVFEKPHHRFIDALILASKVISSSQVLLEICASDDPDYTTGYLASKKFGYVRIPHMKKARIPRGGRLYVIHTETPVEELINYLRNIPVLFDGQISLNDIEGHPLLRKIPSVTIEKSFLGRKG